MKLVPVTVKCHNDDVVILKDAAKACGLSLPKYIEEIVACRASEIRALTLPIPEFTGVPSAASGF